MLEDPVGVASANLGGCTALSECVVLDRRGSAFTQWLYWTAKTFWRWTRYKVLPRSHFDDEHYWDSVTQLQLLNTASAGARTSYTSCWRTSICYTKRPSAYVW